MRPSTRNTQTGSGMFRGSRALDFHQELGEFLFAFGLVFAGFGFSELCDIHAAEFWAAHGAEFGFLVEIVGKRFVVHGTSSFGIEREFKLFVPVEEEARVAESVVAIACAWAVTRDRKSTRLNSSHVSES